LRIAASRLGFCLAIAFVAAALADPLVESASNAGWFGPGAFTDHSNLDVVPALLLGIGLLLLYMARKARAVLDGRALGGGPLRLLPLVLALQVVALYAMETSEQLIAYGHVLNAPVWLGGPVPVSLAVHAILGFALTFAVVQSKRTLAFTTLRVIRLFVEIARLGDRPLPFSAARLQRPCSKQLLPVPCIIGERAPPF
jgi:hypothetical protein